MWFTRHLFVSMFGSVKKKAISDFQISPDCTVNLGYDYDKVYLTSNIVNGGCRNTSDHLTGNRAITVTSTYRPFTRLSAITLSLRLSNPGATHVLGQQRSIFYLTSDEEDCRTIRAVSFPCRYIVQQSTRWAFDNYTSVTRFWYAARKIYEYNLAWSGRALTRRYTI